jgi:hypothetical protein
MMFISGIRRMITNAYLKRKYSHARVTVAMAHELARNKMLWYKELIDDLDDYKEGKMEKSKLQATLKEYGVHFGEDFSKEILVLKASAKDPDYFKHLDRMGKLNGDAQLASRDKLAREFLFAIKPNFKTILGIVVLMEAALESDDVDALSTQVKSYEGELKTLGAVAQLYLKKGLYGGYKVWK